jgi:hypothetical protein
MLLPMAVVETWQKRAQDPCRFLTLWALLPFLFFSLSRSQLPQYVLPIFPALALISGRFLAQRLSDARGVHFILVPWLLVIGILIYFILGAAWPNLLVRYVRAAVAQNLLSLTTCGVLLMAMLVVFLKGYGGNKWRGWAPAYLSTATALALFLFVLGQLTAAVSLERGSRSLARTVAPFISAQDRVVFYDTYLPGMAFYLGADKPLWIAQHEEKSKIMGSNYLAERRPAAAAGNGQVVYSFSEFAQQWKRKGLSLRVVVKEKNLQRLTDDIGASPRILTQHGEYLLLANR